MSEVLDGYEKTVRRVVNLIATPLLLIVVTFFLNRMVNQVDTMNENLNRHIQMIKVNESRLDNHDYRLKSLENWREFENKK